jgi:hypothetical protein
MIARVTVLGLALVLSFAQAEAAPSGGMEKACPAGPRFLPGPIVGGHNRQPTQAEFEARMRELQAARASGAKDCLFSPRAAGTIAQQTFAAGSSRSRSELDA